MHRSTSKLARLIDAKNAVRGAIGNKKKSIIGTVAREIEELEPDSAIEFLGWVSSYPATRYEFYPPSKIDRLEDLSFELAAPWTAIGPSLAWAAGYAESNISALKRFIELRTEFEEAWLRDNISSAEATLATIESELGHSLWLIQTKIAFAQRCHGLEAQKLFARSIHDTAPRTLAAVISHYVSYRNEPTASLTRFRQRVERLLSNPEIESDRRIFTKVQLIGTPLSSLTLPEIATYLGICTGISLLDAYEAFLECLQAILLKPQFHEYKTAIHDAVDALAIPDHRLSKIAAVLRGTFKDVPNRSWNAEDWYVSGDNECAAISFLDQCQEDPSDVDALCGCAAAFAVAAQNPERDGLNSLSSDYLRWSIAIRQRGPDLSANISNAAKSLLNLKTLHSAKALWGHIFSEVSEKLAYGGSPASDLFWSTRLLHPAHSVHLPLQPASYLLEECARRAPGSLIVSLYRKELFETAPSSPDPTTNIDQDVLLETRTLLRLCKGDVTGALASATALTTTVTPVFLRRGAQLETHCLLQIGKTDDAIRRAAHFCCEEDDLRFVLPLSDLLPDDRWRYLKHLRHDIALPVMLDLAMRTSGDSRHATNRRIAYDEFLRAHGHARPSELARNVTGFPLRELIYFLQMICIPEIMDVSFQTFKTSRDLENERIDVCALLSQIDPNNSGVYSEEIKEITKVINLREGLRDVDKSRVHVNLEALISWAQSELKENFQRYKVLAGIHPNQSEPDEIESAMREAAAGQRHALDKYIYYPSGEGDALLLEIFETIKNEYMLNPDFGLDAYLSMRIRHGSLAGHLRGPLEESHLLVPKGKAAKRFAGGLEFDEAGLSPNEIATIESCFVEFSVAYDAIIDDVAKTQLQIRRPEKPFGLFSMEALPLIIYWVRSRIHPETEFNEFLRDVLAAIEVIRNRDLESVRRYLTEDVKSRVEAAFDALRQSLEAKVNSNLYNLINSLIASVLPDVQAAIDRVVDWFATDQAQQIAALRSVEQIVDIAIEATKNARRGFNPKIDRKIEDFGLQSQGVLLEFTDILFTALDNVYRHSEAGDQPWVRIQVTSEECSDPFRKRVRIRLESEIGEGVYNPTAIAKLDRIRALLATGAYRKQVNLEGGTGLLKLKRIVSHDPRQTLDFGFCGQELFFVEVTLLLLFITTQ